MANLSWLVFAIFVVAASSTRILSIKDTIAGVLDASLVEETAQTSEWYRAKGNPFVGATSAGKALEEAKKSAGWKAGDPVGITVGDKFLKYRSLITDITFDEKAALPTADSTREGKIQVVDEQITHATVFCRNFAKKVFGKVKLWHCGVLVTTASYWSFLDFGNVSKTYDAALYVAGPVGKFPCALGTKCPNPPTDAELNSKLQAGVSLDALKELLCAFKELCWYCSEGFLDKAEASPWKPIKYWHQAAKARDAPTLSAFFAEAHRLLDRDYASISNNCQIVTIKLFEFITGSRIPELNNVSKWFSFGRRPDAIKGDPIVPYYCPAPSAGAPDCLSSSRQIEALFVVSGADEVPSACPAFETAKVPVGTEGDISACPCMTGSADEIEAAEVRAAITSEAGADIAAVFTEFLTRNGGVANKATYKTKFAGYFDVFEDKGVLKAKVVAAINPL